MPTRPPVHQPAGSRRAAAQRRALYERTPQRKARQSLYDHAWRAYSKRRLSLHPYCVRCYARGVLRLAVVTDHIAPHLGDPVVFRDPDNHQSLCKTCHDRKTRREDHGRTPSAKPARHASLPSTTATRSEHEQPKPHR